jgi:hypothetical protein
MAQDLATARLQEQLAAQQMFGQISSQGREQDIGLAQAQAGLNQQAGLAGYQGQLQTNLAQGQIDAQRAAINAQMVQGFNDLVAQYQQMGLSAEQANQAAMMGVDSSRVGNINSYNAQKAANDAAHKQMIANMIMQGGAAMATGGASMAVPVAAAAVSANQGSNTPQSGTPNQGAAYSNVT